MSWRTVQLPILILLCFPLFTFQLVLLTVYGSQTYRDLAILVCDDGVFGYVVDVARPEHRLEATGICGEEIRYERLFIGLRHLYIIICVIVTAYWMYLYL